MFGESGWGSQALVRAPLCARPTLLTIPIPPVALVPPVLDRLDLAPGVEEGLEVIRVVDVGDSEAADRARLNEAGQRPQRRERVLLSANSMA